MSKICVTGSEGFIASYIVPQLLEAGHEIVGIDNLCKYGPTERKHHGHPKYTFLKEDAKNEDLLKEILTDCDHFIHASALIGGVSFFNSVPASLFCENERLMASGFEAAKWAHNNRKLKKITAISSSMIYENAVEFPSKEGSEENIAPPFTCYGFQKLAVHYWAKGYLSEFGLPYSIAVPFNCVGTGEVVSKTFDKVVMSGNIKLAMTHVIPDLIHKVAAGQDPVHILGQGNQIRHFTYGADLARGIIMLMEDEKHLNRPFNLSTPHGHTVKQVLQLIWEKIGPKKPLEVVCDPAYDHDVICRIPDTTDAKELLGFEAKKNLNDILDEIIPWYQNQFDNEGWK